MLQDTWLNSSDKERYDHNGNFIKYKYKWNPPITPFHLTIKQKKAKERPSLLCPVCGEKRPLTVDWKGSKLCRPCLLQSYE
jgi:hypothetical protein